MKKLIVTLLLAAITISVSACSLPGSKKADTAREKTLSGTHETPPPDSYKNAIKWKDISVSLPRTFPEIKVNGSSNLNNFMSQRGVTSVTWTEVKEADLTDITKFLEGELGTTFKKEGEAYLAKSVTISGTKYMISLSFAKGDPDMITMTITVA